MKGFSRIQNLKMNNRENSEYGNYNVNITLASQELRRFVCITNMLVFGFENV